MKEKFDPEYALQIQYLIFWFNCYDERISAQTYGKRGYSAFTLVAAENRFQQV